jgi:hypothetical protein
MRERVVKKQLKIQFILTDDQLEDGFTKTLSVAKQNGLNLGWLQLREVLEIKDS